MEKKRCSSQQLKEGRSCAVQRGPDGQGTPSESLAVKKRKKKKKAGASESTEISGEAPPLSFHSHQQTAPCPTKKQFPGKDFHLSAQPHPILFSCIIHDSLSIGGSHCSSELSSNSSIGRPVATDPAAGSSCSSLETSQPPSKTSRSSEHPPHSKSTSNGGASPLKLKPPSTLSDGDEDGLPAVSGTRDSLRWEERFSDEEREGERVEEYKKNRRKRYTKHFRVLQQTAHPSPFYTPSESLS